MVKFLSPQAFFRTPLPTRKRAAGSPSPLADALLLRKRLLFAAGRLASHLLPLLLYCAVAVALLAAVGLASTPSRVSASGPDPDSPARRLLLPVARFSRLFAAPSGSDGPPRGGAGSDLRLPHVPEDRSDAADTGGSGGANAAADDGRQQRHEAADPHLISSGGGRRHPEGRLSAQREPGALRDRPTAGGRGAAADADGWQAAAAAPSDGTPDSEAATSGGSGGGASDADGRRGAEPEQRLQAEAGSKVTAAAEEDGKEKAASAEDLGQNRAAAGSGGTGSDSSAAAAVAADAKRSEVESGGGGGGSRAGKAAAAPQAAAGLSPRHAEEGGAGRGGDTQKDGAGAAGVLDATLGGPPLRLYYSKGDEWIGMQHWRMSFVCSAAEARALNRTLVVSRWMGITSSHSLKGEQETHPLEWYIDVEYLKSRQPLVFLEDVQLALGCADLSNVTCVRQRMEVAAFGFPAHTRQLARHKEAGLVLRQKSEQHPWNYFLCDWLHKGELTKFKDSSLARPPPMLRPIVAYIRAAMDNDYDAVHVRRGDKLWYPNLWPHLDWDTRPQALVQKLSKLLTPGRNLYIASDEKAPGFFDPLMALFQVHRLSDFSALWAPGSRWQAEARRAVAGQLPALAAANATVEFDAFMEVIVEYAVLDGAKKHLETFNHLTEDPRDGCWGERTRPGFPRACLA